MIMERHSSMWLITLFKDLVFAAFILLVIDILVVGYNWTPISETEHLIFYVLFFMGLRRGNSNG